MIDRKDRTVEFDRIKPSAGAGAEKALINIAPGYLFGFRRSGNKYPAAVPELLPPVKMLFPSLLDWHGGFALDLVVQLLEPAQIRGIIRRQDMDRDMAALGGLGLQGARIGFLQPVAQNRRAKGPAWGQEGEFRGCLLYTSPSPRDRTRSRMPSSA